ncbi:conserved protein, unknown function, partial [Hepatocystis sp. ex Piliocolobus tephrosceles]
MNNDNDTLYRNNQWTLPNVCYFRFEYLASLGDEKYIPEKDNRDNEEKKTTTDMFIYTGQHVEKVSINTYIPSTQMHRNKLNRFQYLKEKISNVVKSKEQNKENIINENLYLNIEEIGNKENIFFDINKNEIKILNNKENNKIENKNIKQLDSDNDKLILPKRATTTATCIAPVNNFDTSDSVDNITSTVNNSTSTVNNFTKDVNNSTKDVNNSTKDVNNSTKDVNNSTKDVNNSTKDANNPIKDINEDAFNYDNLSVKDRVKQCASIEKIYDDNVV